MRVDELAAGRIAEAVVRGTGRAHAPGSPYLAAADGIAMTAAILDDLLARGTTGRSPGQLSGGMDRIAASGRAGSSGTRPPLIG